jgi:hypothetical protein
MISLSLEGTSIRLPAGVVAGQKISIWLAYRTLPVHHVNDFHNFPSRSPAWRRNVSVLR